MSIFDTIKNFADPLRGIGTDPFGTGAANSANNANRRRYGNALREFGTLGNQLETQYGQAQGYLSHLLPTINKGYGQARTGLISAGQNAKQGVLDRGVQQQAASSQSMASRGLYNTTAVDAASRGIHADTSRALAGIDESIGQMLANFNIGQAQAQGGAYSALAGLAQNKFGAYSDVAHGKVGTISSRQDVAAPSLISQLGPFAALMGSMG